MDQRRRATSGLERSGLGTVSGTYFCSKCRHSRRERRAHPSGVGAPRAPPAPAHMRRPPGRSRSGFSSRPTLTRRYWLKRSGSGPTGAVSAGRRMLEGVGHLSPGRCKAAKSGANPVLSRNCDAPRGRARSTAGAERTPALGGKGGSSGSRRRASSSADRGGFSSADTQSSRGPGRRSARANTPQHLRRSSRSRGAAARTRPSRSGGCAESSSSLKR